MFFFTRLEKSNSNRSKYKRISVCICDFCYNKFERKFINSLDFHFCSDYCRIQSMKVGGVFNQKTINSCQEKFGANYPLLNSVLKKQAEETTLKNHGVKNIFQKESVQKLSRLAQQKPEVRLKKSKSLKINAKQRLDKGRETLQKRYNVTHNLEIPGIRENIDYVKSAQKIHETMKQNGSYQSKISNVEKLFLNILLKKFHIDDIEQQKFVHKWPIDFYIKSIDTYVQVDGVYWHGLDRNLVEIFASNGARDRNIMRKRQIDFEQNMWFFENQLQLFRFTDTDVYSLKNELLNRI